MWRMTPDPSVKSLARLSVATGCIVMITGCSPPLNGSDGLLGENALPAVSMDAAETKADVATQPKGDVVAFDRSTWSIRTIVIDQAQVQHHPSYGSFRPVWNTSDSAEGQPTIATVFKTGNDRNDEFMNGILAPLAAGLELIVLPFRMIGSPPWSIMTSPHGQVIMPPPDDAAHDVRIEWLDSDSTDEKDRP